MRISRYHDSGHITCISEPWHAAIVRSIAWQISYDTSAMPSLLTQTTDGKLRIWRCSQDEPDFYILWHTLRSKDSCVTGHWLLDEEGHQQGVLSIDLGGQMRITDLQNMHHMAFTSAKVSQRICQSRLSGKELSRLRYTTVKSFRSTTFLLGRSRRGSLAILRISWESQQSPLACRIVRQRNAGPDEVITMSAVSEDGTFVVTAGEAGQILVWQARRLDKRVAEMAVQVRHRLDGDTRTASHLSISPDGKYISVASHAGIRMLFVESGSIRDLSSLPDAEQSGTIHALVLDSTNDGRIHCVYVDETAVCVWQIEPNAATPVNRATLNGEICLAALCPQVVSNTTRFVAVDTSGQLLVGSVTLDGMNTSSRQLASFPDAAGRVRLLAASVNNHVAMGELTLFRVMSES